MPKTKRKENLVATLPPEQWVEPTPEKMLEVFGMAWDYFVPEREPAKRLTDDELRMYFYDWEQLPLFPSPKKRRRNR